MRITDGEEHWYLLNREGENSESVYLAPTSNCAPQLQFHSIRISGKIQDIYKRLGYDSFMDETRQIRPVLLWTMSIGAGVSVANLYYIQPLLAIIAGSFHISTSASGSLATVTQAGYAIGMLLLVPLGDVLEKKKFILIMLALVGGSLVAMSAAQGLRTLMAASLLVGVTTVTPQLIVPFAAHLAPQDQRGRVVGTVMSGLFAGILLARTFSGLVASRFGWRMVYLLAAMLTVGLMVAFRILLPRSEPQQRALNYGELLRSLIALVQEEPMLRSSAFFGAMGFGAFSGFWTVLPFRLAEPPYRFGPGAVGLFALLGVSGIIVAPLAGRLADRGRSRLTIGCGLAAILAAYAVMAFTSAHVAILMAGLILLDLGTTATHISNQARVYSVRPEARNRMTTVYMFGYFCGGAAGSLVAIQGWTRGGWPGLCLAAGSFAIAGLTAYAFTHD